MFPNIETWSLPFCIFSDKLRVSKLSFGRLTHPPNHTVTNWNWVLRTLTIRVKVATKTPKSFPTFFAFLINNMNRPVDHIFLSNIPMVHPINNVFWNLKSLGYCRRTLPFRPWKSMVVDDIYVRSNKFGSILLDI